MFGGHIPFLGYIGYSIGVVEGVGLQSDNVEYSSILCTL